MRREPKAALERNIKSPWKGDLEKGRCGLRPDQVQRVKQSLAINFCTKESVPFIFPLILRFLHMLSSATNETTTGLQVVMRDVENRGKPIVEGTYPILRSRLSRSSGVDAGAKMNTKPKRNSTDLQFKCEECDGSGKVRSQEGFFTVERTCILCGGAGAVSE